MDEHGTRKIVGCPLDEMPESGVAYEWLKLTPYPAGKNTDGLHDEYRLSYRRVIASTQQIPHPELDHEMPVRQVRAVR